MDGVLNVLKPPGMTSHDVVSHLRRRLGVRKTGHAGTLDPPAAGVLLVCLGRATRLSEYLAGCDKFYRAELTFGVETDTQDQTGKITSRRDASSLDRQTVERVLRGFLGVQEQVPPMVSAKKWKGMKLYELARRGVTVERKPQRITVHSLVLRQFSEGKFPRALLDISCSKGTYIRTLCRDIGARVGYGAHLSALIRTKAGGFNLSESLTLEEIDELHRRCCLGEALISMNSAVRHLPAVVLTEKAAAKTRNGVPPLFDECAVLPHGLEPGIRVRVQWPAGHLLAVARVNSDGTGFRLEKVFPT